MVEPAPIDFQRIFLSFPGLFLLLRPDADFTILDASDACLRATLTNRAEIVGRALFDVFPDNPDEAHATGTTNLRASLERVIATKASDTMAVQKYDICRPASQGGGFEERYWSPVNSPILSADRELLYIVHRVEDVTEFVHMGRRERDERGKLVEASDRFQAVYDQGLFAGRLDLDGVVIDVNRSSLEQCGFVRGDVIGKPFWECGWWNRSPHVQAWVKGAVAQCAQGEPFRGESIYFWADGTERVVDFACMPIRDEAGKVQFIVPTGMDITGETQAVRDQRATEILESITEGLLALDRDWRFTYVNREAQNILGRNRSDLLGKVIAVDAIVRNAVETSQPLIEAAGHQLSVSLPDNSLWLEGDPVRLAQVLANLLNNAAKYTHPGGHISVHARRDDDAITISVRDNGVGIAPEALPRMFEMFSRGDRVSGGGLGIGLALARRLAEMHGGSLDAHSAGPGKGSEFTMRLPVVPHQASQPATTPQVECATVRQRILVVDDNPDAADSPGMLLALLGADVRIARDGPEALEAFHSYNPSVVLLDIGMPGMDGYQVARAIRTRFPERRTAIVALTGWGQDKDRRQAQEAGFDHHLVKPAEIGALQTLLASLPGTASDERAGA